MDQNIVIKVGDKKWHTVGSLKVNKWGNLSLSLRKCPELEAHMNNDSQWVNFHVFDKKEDSQPEVPVVDSDEIPF